jgi:protease-4
VAKPHKVKTSFLLSTIFKELWALDPRMVIAHVATINGLIKGNVFEADREPLRISYLTSEGKSIVADIIDLGNPSTQPPPKVPPGSIAIIKLKGTMLKEDTLCSYGTISIANALTDAANNKDVIGIIIDADTGGGAVNSVPPLMDAILAARKTKPVVCLADTLASAGIWAMAACDEIWASNTISSMFGSIGVMYSYTNISKYLELQGIVETNIYPDESDQKNYPFEELLKGNTEPLKQEMLSPVARKFQSDIKKNIKSLDASVPGILNGKMFFAQDALKYGMIQGIGTMEDVVARVRKLAKNTKGSSAASNSSIQSKVTNQNSTTMKYATICTLLGLTGLEFGKDGKASLTKEQVSQIQGAYKMKHKADLELKGLTYDEEGFAAFSENEFQQMEDALNADPAAATTKGGSQTAAAAAGAQQDGNGASTDGDGTQAGGSSAAGSSASTASPDFNAAFAAFQKKIDERFLSMEQRILGDSQQAAPATGRIIQIGTGAASGTGKGLNPNYVHGVVHDINLASATRPWNQKALGLLPMSASTEINLDQVNQDLGAYSRQFITELQNLLIGDVLEPIFPTVSGVQDQLVTFSLWVEEVTQAYQKAWTPKGGISIQPEIVKMFDIKIDTQFEDLKAIEKTWLSDYNKEGSQAYKLSFVGYLLKLILIKARQEDNIAAIKGVYKTPVAGVSGKSINKQDGLYEKIRKSIAEKKIKEFSIGEWNDANILDWERSFVLSIPETVRDTPNLALYVPTNYIEARWRKKRLLEGNYKDYDPNKSTIDGHENIRLIAVPYAGDIKRVICTYIGNIRQLEYISTDKDFITLEKEKRVINAFGDYKKSIHIGFTGKKEANAEDISYENQRIWINDADEPETTYITVDPDVTVPSVSVHTSLVTSANTQPTVITDIADRKAGQKIRLKCGSTTNASTITNGGNFVLASNWSPTNIGDELILLVRSDLKMVEYQRLSAATQAIELTADAADPSLGNFANGVKFITNDGNTAAVAITNFADATVGVEFTLYSSNPAAKATSIANAGNFVLTSAWAESANGWIRLMKRPDGKFIETARS